MNAELSPPGDCPLKPKMSESPERMYKDLDGNDCTLFQLIKKEPQWALSIIAEFRKSEEVMRGMVERADKKEQVLRDLVENLIADDPDKLIIGKYNELINAVQAKFPDESQHDTALRYIKDHEGCFGLGKERQLGEKE